MGKINLLSPGVFNMIAAGEVVERPASVVKELVENSIDAGATEIFVEAQEGGTRLIRVSDNGSGIMKDDLRAAFLPHATSKLSEISDLDTISTLGFRGEALASIASVSEVVLTSRADGADRAYTIRLEGGKVVEETEDSRAKGTSITVSDLFFNTPARLKFLKKPSTELGYIADAVEKIVLASPELKISMFSEKGAVIEHGGGDLSDAIASVYPEIDPERLIRVERVSSSGITVRGYVSEPSLTFPTRGRQTVIVNGRAVVNDTVSAAVDKAFRDYLVKRTFPMYVLDILVPFEEVDVNVHPAKSEVRFRNKNAVFGAVLRAVEEAINGFSDSEKFRFVPRADESHPERVEQTSFDTAELYDTPAAKAADSELRRENIVYSSLGVPLDISSLRTVGKTYGRRSTHTAADSPVGPYAGFGTSRDPLYDEAFVLNRISEDDDEDFAHSLNNKFRLFDGAVVGQIFDTYLIVERADVVYIIDQHAAHERVLYDKLSASLSSEYSQPLLVPYKLRLTGSEAEYFEKMLPALNEMGFKADKSAGAFLIYAVPEPVVRMNFDRFVSALFVDMLDENELKLTDLVKEVVCRDACRAAIKGGEHLTKRQIEYVLSNLIDEKGELPQKCPHGRPAVVALTRRDLEKMFLRVIG